MTKRAVGTILYVRLPVWKIWPGGIVYLADFIHKQRPHIRQEILDLAVIPPAERIRLLRQRCEELKPDVVAFSWRNMQTFGPHPENDALDVVMNFDHSPRLLRRLGAAWDALRIIWDYAYSRWRNFSYLKLVRRMLPETRIVVGGTAVSIFGRYVAEKCPPDTVIAVGEGEDVMLSVADGFGVPEGHHYYRDPAGQLIYHPAEENFALEQLTAIDFAYIESIFPAFHSYLGETIGIQTKRGCPFQCQFCLYNKIEGMRQRYRDPAEIAREIEILEKGYGVKRIWFTDAQFCSTRRSMQHVEQILDQMIARGIKVGWTGYLRLNHLTPEIARKMLETGLESIDLSFAGTQDIVDSLALGYELEQQMEAFRMFREAGHSDQKVKLYMPLNAPRETPDTLRATLKRIHELYEIFGRDNVLPFIFFIGIQPGTPIERNLLEKGYLKPGYDPLTLNPFLIKKLLYNPQPLGALIGSAYLEALDKTQSRSEEEFDYIGRTTMEILEQKLAAVPQPPPLDPPGQFPLPVRSAS